MTKRLVAVGVLVLMFFIAFRPLHAIAAEPLGLYWRSQMQTCGGLNSQGVCEKWINSGTSDTTNTSAPKAKGSPCGDAIKCIVETKANETRYVYQWMIVCPLSGRPISAK